MPSSAWASEKITAATTGGGAFAMGGVIGVLDHLGYEFPTWVWVIWGCVCALLTLICFGLSAHMAFVWWRNRRTPSAPTPGVSPNILIECRLGPMLKEIPASGEFYAIDLWYNERAGGGLARHFGPAGSPVRPPEDETLRLATICEVTNYASEPLVAVELTATVDFFKANADGSVRLSNVFASQSWPFTIPKIEAGAGAKFTFYVVNSSNYPARIRFGKEGAGQLLSEDSARPLGVRTTGDVIHVMFPQPNG